MVRPISSRRLYGGGERPIQNSSSEKNSEKAVMEGNGVTSVGLTQVLWDMQKFIQYEFMETPQSPRTATFTGYVDIQTGKGCNGLVSNGKFRIQICGDTKMSYQLIVADVGNKKIITEWTANSVKDKLKVMDLLEMEEGGELELTPPLRHREGGVLNTECFGYGKEYNDENNEVMYEGFVFGGKRVCYGKEYRGVCCGKGNDLLYEGGYLDGARYGYGISYDCNGLVEYEGEWIEGNPMNAIEKCIVIRSVDNLFISTLIEEIVVVNQSLNDKEVDSLHFSSLFTRLKRIEIGSECFKNVRRCVLDGLDSLESMKIGKGCFVISNNEREDGVFRITNCPTLFELDVGNKCFMDFKQFELWSANSLQSIQFGDSCFSYAETCILKGE